MALSPKLTDQGLPKPVIVPPSQRAYSGNDKLMLLGALLNDLGEGSGPRMTMSTQQHIADRARKEAERSWQQGLIARMGGAGAAGGPGGMIGGLGGVERSPGATPVQAGGMVDEDLLPYLMQGIFGGYAGAGDAAGLYEKMRPKVSVENGVAYDPYKTKPGERIGTDLSNVNGFMVDTQDPKNAGRFFGEAPVKGAEPLLNQRGEHVGWKLMDGTVQTIEQTRAAEKRGEVGETFFSVPNPDGSTTFTLGKDYRDGGAGGGRGAGTSQTPADKVYGDRQAAAAADKFKAYDEAGTAAAGKIGRLRQMATLLGDVDGGRLTPTGMEIASVANSLGIKLDPKLGNKEAANALSNQLALDMMGGSLGAGFSNADRDFVTSMVPRLGQSIEGRTQLINMAISAEERKQKVATMARQWQQRFGRIDTPDRNGKTFEDYLAIYADQNRLFGAR